MSYEMKLFAGFGACCGVFGLVVGFLLGGLMTQHMECAGLNTVCNYYGPDLGLRLKQRKPE